MERDEVGSRAVVSVERAQEADIDQLVELETGLFAEDAGVHDEFADVTWPAREGAGDFITLLGSSESVVLVARADDGVVGFVAGYRSSSSPSRQPVTYGVLRSIYVDKAARGSGVGRALVTEFVEWARSGGCAEVVVDSYVKNVGAGRLYEGSGFVAQSMSRRLRLSSVHIGSGGAKTVWA
jgi:ribosomal protein S18 acetylase RimI-like enzyme